MPLDDTRHAGDVPGGRVSADDFLREDVPRTVGPGTVILLNGTSSSGKSSIAKALLPLLAETYFHMPVDAFHAMRVDRGIADEDLQAEIDRTSKGFHRAVAGMAAAGNNLVVDYPLSRRWRLLDCLDLLDSRRVMLVKVYCPRAELVRRETERGDRTPGLAAAQYPVVHAHGVHDITVDTGRESPRQCAERIARRLSGGLPRPTAFERLAAALPSRVTG
ncbi:chloramphenicol phosphotransferase CPT family protein [Streptomyces sp. NRRL F-5126]|uniref:chloramphenicol phosphotransferase CPT family protein n=1 Tax=Streptomyces sp. NRRL F-5126 TaxID=1463857 RepID=UPI00099DB4AB|nr:AAA family ATPase [Streptomyces sp. NRRL F-5126]